MKTIHCGTDIKPDGSLSPVKGGLWTTLIGTCTISELSTYIAQSKLCTEGVYLVSLRKNAKSIHAANQAK